MKNDNLKMPIFLFTWLILVTVYFFTENSAIELRILFKAMPEILIGAALVASRKRIDRPTLAAVICALVFSVLGDSAGEFKGGRIHQAAFVTQIAMFIVAQICYSASFIRHIDFRQKIRIPAMAAVKALLCLVFAAGLGFVAWKVIPAMDSPAFVVAGCIYVAALALSGFSSILQNRRGQAFYICGTALFIFSDSVIAIGSFVAPVAHSGLIIMTTYFLAQLLLNYRLIAD